MTPDEAKQRIEDIRLDLVGFVPDEMADWFVEGVKNAVAVYVAIPYPPKVSQEISDLVDHLHKPDDKLADRLAGLSDGALDLIKVYGGRIPNANDLNDPVKRNEVIRTLIGVLTTGGNWRTQKTQRRYVENSIGAVPRGRPKVAREQVLVSFIAAAYAGAASRHTTRSWHIEPKTDDDLSEVERLISIVLKALSIEHHNVKNLVRRHVESMS